jgi:hypothetical protein
MTIALLLCLGSAAGWFPLTVYGYRMAAIAEMAPGWRERGSIQLRLREPFYDGEEVKVRAQRGDTESSGRPLWMTRYGPLDVLGAIGQAHDYEDLVEHVDPMEAGPGLSIKVLRLSKRIEVKSERAVEEDLARLPILRRPLEEKSRR